MSTPPSGPRPARLAAFILLGVAVVAVGLGVFALTSNSSGSQAGGGPSTTANPPASSSAARTTTGKPSARPTTTAPPTTSYPSGQTTTVAPPPPAGGTGTGNGGSGGTGAGGGGAIGVAGNGTPVAVRVYNNSTIPKLAAAAAQDFTNAGYDVVETGNYSESQGVIPTTTVYYSPAPGEQQTAQALGQQFNMRVQPRFPGIASASPGVIVIVTNDFKGPH